MERKAYHVGLLSAEAKKLENQARFIQEMINNEIEIFNRPIATILQTLRERNYDPDPLPKWKGRRKQQADDEDTDAGIAAYAYLLDMPIECLLVGPDQKLEDLETLSEGAPDVGKDAESEAQEDVGPGGMPKNSEARVKAESGTEGALENLAPKASRKRASEGTGEKGTPKKRRNSSTESDAPSAISCSSDDEERYVISIERKTSRAKYGTDDSDEKGDYMDEARPDERALEDAEDSRPPHVVQAATDTHKNGRHQKAPNSGRNPKLVAKRLSGGKKTREKAFDSLLGANDSGAGSSPASGSKVVPAPPKGANRGSKSKPSLRPSTRKAARKKAPTKKRPARGDSAASDIDEEKPKTKKAPAARRRALAKKKLSSSDSSSSDLDNFKRKKATPAARKPATSRRLKKPKDSGAAPKKSKQAKKA